MYSQLISEVSQNIQVYLLIYSPLMSESVLQYTSIFTYLLTVNVLKVLLLARKKLFSEPR